MSEVAALMAAFHEATGREAAIWERRDGSVTPTLIGASSTVFASLTENGALAWDVNSWARRHRLHAQLVSTGESVGWLFVEPGITPEGDRLLGRLVPFVQRLGRERDGAAHELVERYEEINLLYAIGELLGGTTAVEGVADTLLRELAVTVGAPRAVFLVTDRAQNALAPIATLGITPGTYAAVSFDDTSHIALRAFRTTGACTEDGPAVRVSDPVLSADGRP